MEHVSTASNGCAGVSYRLNLAELNPLERLEDGKEGEDEEDKGGPVDELGARLVNDWG